MVQTQESLTRHGRPVTSVRKHLRNADLVGNKI